MSDHREIAKAVSSAYVAVIAERLAAMRNEKYEEEIRARKAWEDEEADRYRYRFGKLLEFMRRPGQQIDLFEEYEGRPSVTHKVTCVGPLCESADAYLRLGVYGAERILKVLVPPKFDAASIANTKPVEVLLRGMLHHTFRCSMSMDRVYSWGGRNGKRYLTLDVAGAFFREVVDPLVTKAVDVFVSSTRDVKTLIMQYHGMDEWSDEQSSHYSFMYKRTEVG